MLSDLDEREQVRTARKRRGRVALAVDMLKSYAGPVVLAAFLNPLLQNGAGGSSRFGVYNYLLLVAGLAMIGLAFIFAPEGLSMPDIVIIQLVILIAAVALMAFTTYEGLKLRAYEKRLDREADKRGSAE